VIEFALPDHLLDEAVEKWKLKERADEEGYTMGVDHPVVIRFADRADGEKETWRSWRDQFRAGRLPVFGSPSWDRLWIRCGDARTRDQLNGLLRRTSQVPLVAMTAWHHRGKSLPAAVAAARHAGAPVIVWQHKPCVDHATPNGTGDACRGGRFQQAAAHYLSAASIDELPERVRLARAAAMSGTGDDAGQDIAILWDDPDRRPWDKAPRNRAPISTAQVR
jgi:hypothetical protein